VGVSPAQRPEVGFLRTCGGIQICAIKVRRERDPGSDDTAQTPSENSRRSGPLLETSLGGRWQGLAPALMGLSAQGGILVYCALREDV